MTTSTFPTSRPAADRTRQRRPALLGAVGAVLLALGGIAAAAAIGLIAIFGTSGTLDSGRHRLASTGTALVTDVSHLQNTRGVGTLTGWPTLHVTAEAGTTRGVFVGIGPAEAVDRYLSGAATDQITDLRLHPFAVTTTPHPGAAVVAPPTAAGFWVASSSSTSDAGSEADLTWQVRDGDFRLVVMNADGGSNVSAVARAQVSLPDAFPISLLVLAGSVLVIAVGSVLLVLAIRRSRVTARRGGAAA
jgi:hypothetical protein